MCNKLYRKIALWCCEYHRNSPEEIEVIVYGIGVAIENIARSLLLMAIGIFFNQLKECLIILSSFCGLRIHAGGLHAKTSLGCTILMVTVVSSTLLFNRFIEVSNFICLGITILSNILIGILAPNGSESCQLLDEREKWEKKKCAIYTVNILFCAAFILKVKTLVFIPIFLEALSLLLFRIQERLKYEKNEAVVKWKDRRDR